MVARVHASAERRDLQEKLSEEELAARMARIREQNEKIKQRRLVCVSYPQRWWVVLMNIQDVEQDEAEFRKTQEAERVKLAKNRKVQEGIDRAREQAARRKMDKVSVRHLLFAS